MGMLFITSGAVRSAWCLSAILISTALKYLHQQIRHYH